MHRELKLMSQAKAACALRREEEDKTQLDSKAV